MRVVFFGTPAFSAAFLAALHADTDIEVVGVVCQPDEPMGRKKVLTAPPTKVFAESNGIPVFQPTKLKSDEAFLTAIDQLHADVAVIVAYGRILPKILLDRLPHGFVNVHPSLLPKYRGPSPMQAAIAAGDSVTGVSIMTIDEGMDTGPLLAQCTIELTPNETTDSLTAKVVKIGAPLLLDTLKRFVGGSIAPKAQSSEGISICHLLSKEDGKIDWTQQADEINAKIRAYTPWPGCWTIWPLKGADAPVKILHAETFTPAESLTGPIGVPLFSENSLIVPAGNNQFLNILSLQPAGKNPMKVTDFANGYLK